MLDATTIKPSWTCADREVDASDVWQEETDHQAERGDICTAFLHHDEVNCDEYGFVLKGIAVTDEFGLTLYHDRATAIRLMSDAAVWRIEASELEAGSKFPNPWMSA